MMAAQDIRSYLKLESGRSLQENTASLYLRGARILRAPRTISKAPHMAKDQNTTMRTGLTNIGFTPRAIFILFQAQVFDELSREMCRETLHDQIYSPYFNSVKGL
jgi:hypothetical protein